MIGTSRFEAQTMLVLLLEDTFPGVIIDCPYGDEDEKYWSISVRHEDERYYFYNNLALGGILSEGKVAFTRGHGKCEPDYVLDLADPNFVEDLKIKIKETRSELWP